MTHARDSYQVTLNALHLHHELRGLLPYTNYSISIAAVTVSTGPFSSDIVVEMPEAGKLTYFIK